MIEKLREKLGPRVMENEPLAKHTNFRIGGPAKYFFEARTADEIVAAVTVAGEFGLSFFVLGGGSNILVSDNGFNGLIIKTANRDVKIDGVRVITGAGAPTALVANKAAEAGLTGFEWAATLPGTIGGAVRGNAGCFGGEMQDVVCGVMIFLPKQSISNSREVRMRENTNCFVFSAKGGCASGAENMRTGGAMSQKDRDTQEIGLWVVKEIGGEQCGFGYRDSTFKHKNPPPIILSVILKLQRNDPKACVARIEEKLRIRKEKQPLGASSAGCIFKNVEFRDESEIAKLREHVEVPEEFLRARRIPAGWIIEQLGLKGHRIGDAQISEKHGNFVLNLGKATADEVVQLIAFVKTRSRNELGIQLQEEVQYVGFEGSD